MILGGGFAGLYAASHLGRAEIPGVLPEVVLVSDRNHFTFTPLLAEVVGGALGPEPVTVACRVLARRFGFRFRLASVEGIAPAARRVDTSSGTLEYDCLLVALGGGPQFFGNREIADRALPFTTAEHAAAIRDRIVLQAERAAEEADARVRHRLLTFVVAGGGPAGVEAASEIQGFLAGILPRYYGLRGEGRVALVEGGDRLLRGWDDELVAHGQDVLRARGLDVRLRTRVAGFDGGSVHLSGPDGEARIEADTLVWTAGTSPASGPLAGSLPLDEGGHLAVDEHLRVPGLERVFAAGDVTRLENPRTGAPYPAVAPIAISQGVRAAGNIENLLAGRALEPYRAHHAGKIVSLGRGTALVDVLGWHLTGPAAWFVYRITYLLKLPGLRNKLHAVLSLALDRIFGRNLGTHGRAGREIGRGTHR